MANYFTTFPPLRAIGRFLLTMGLVMLIICDYIRNTERCLCNLSVNSTHKYGEYPYSPLPVLGKNWVSRIYLQL